MASTTVPGFFERFASKLRFPQLFMLASGLFLLDLLIPDLIPFADEILLGLLTLILGMLRGRTEHDDERPPMKDVTPRS